MKTDRLLSAAVVGLLGLGASSIGFADEAPAEAAKWNNECWGANACKGKTECHTSSNECKGENSCKSKGWVSAKDEKACAAKHGFTSEELLKESLAKKKIPAKKKS